MTQILRPSGWRQPSGYAHGIAARGRMVVTAGHIGWDENGHFHSSKLPDQVRQALRNVVAVVAEAGGRPEHIVRLTWYITDKNEYMTQLKEIGRVYREVMGGHYPAMAVVQVAGLIEVAAKVEIEATAVIPD
jgi:enamine deaminase RidA (YjgF/YER057c/UK114 family)